jgi:tRNA(Ile)-lysidine synthetase-like protein
VDFQNSLADRVAAQIAPLLPAHSSILIGLSGGVDSVVLLHLLHKLAARFSWQLSAVHVHHGISPHADAWVEFCMELCAPHHIPLHIEHVDIAPLRAAHGIEAAARKLRHAAFARQPCDFVALAHHADDQAETLLLQLLRGAGVRGASAMPVLSLSKRPVLSLMEPLTIRLSCQETPVKSLAMSKRPLLAERAGSHDAVRPELDETASHSTKPASGQVAGYVEGYRVAKSKSASTGSARTESKNICAGSIVRPLLHCSRQEILDYAAAHNLQWIEDESNADDNYPRNFLRHRVLPLLNEKFPAYRSTLSRSAQHFAEANSLLDELAHQDAAQTIEGETLAVSALQALNTSRAKNLLRYFLHGLNAPMPQAVQLNDMLQQLCHARKDAAVCIAYGGWQIRRYQGKVYALRALGKFNRSLVLPWRGEAELWWPALNACLYFDQEQHPPGEILLSSAISLSKLQGGQVTLRLRRGGEYLRPHPDAATRSLKNLLQEQHIPTWQRDRLPLMYCGEKLVCVLGVAVAADYLPDKQEAQILFSMRQLGCVTS